MLAKVEDRGRAAGKVGGGSSFESCVMVAKVDAR